MTTYNIHIYREIRLVFSGIEADTLEAAAAIARDKPTEHADDIADCDGETFYACVDVQGDEEYLQSRWIDFEPERERLAAGALLSTLKAVAELRRKWRSQDEAETIDSIEYMDGLDALELDAVIAGAEAAGVLPQPTAPKLRAALTWLLDDLTDAGEDREPETGVEYDSVAFARATLAGAPAVCPPSEPAAPAEHDHD